MSDQKENQNVADRTWRAARAQIQSEQEITRTAQNKTQTEQAITKTAQAETETKQADTKTEQSQTKANQNHTRMVQAATQTEQDKTRTAQAETQIEQARTRTMEQALRASELSYRRLFEAAQDGILILDVDTGRVTDVNPFLTTLLGFSHEEMIGKTVGELSPFRDIVSNQAILEQLQSDGYVRYEDLPLKTKDNRQIAVEFVSNVYQAGDKNVIQCNIRDITDRKKAEQHLHLLKTCVSHLNEIILVTEAESIDEPGPKIVYVNDAFERLTGYSAAEAIGRSPRFLQGEKTDRKVLAEIHGALQRREPIKRQMINYKKDGTEYWMDIDVVPIFDTTGNCTHFAAIERDITKAKMVEVQLLWKTAFFEAQVNSALDAIIVVDSEGKKLLENPQMFVLWNHPKEILETLDHRRRLEWVANLVKNPRQFAEKVAHLYAHPNEVSRDLLELNNGKYFDRYTAPVRGLDGKYFGRIWTYRDITEKQRIEARFRRLVDSNAQGVIFWNTKGQITEANDSFLKLMGYTRADLEDGPIDWFAMTPPEWAERDQQALKELAAKGVCTPFEKEYILKDGSRVPVLIGAATFEDNPNEGVCFVLDLTERKKMEAQFRQAQKMEAIGQLAGGVAHDFNNILSAVQMQADLLKFDGGLSPNQAESLEDIIDSVKRATALTRQFLLFSRREVFQLRDLDLNETVTGTTKMLKRMLGETIKIQLKLAAQPVYVHADAGMLDQVLMNLCVNARDAMPSGGQLVIETAGVEIDELTVSQCVQARPGTFVRLSVSDNGGGIVPEILPQIFEPFFTTKDVGKGTGLGLATVFGIVQQHQGWINVYSEVGHGTTFRIYLPQLTGNIVIKPTPPAFAALRGGNETILLVEDDPALRVAVRKALSQLGYRILEAPTGLKALNAWKKNRDEISLLLTDLVMPDGMSGKDLAQRLLRENPKLKVVYMSGYSAEVVGKDFPFTEDVNFLTKPFPAQKLAQTIRDRLDKAA